MAGEYAESGSLPTIYSEMFEWTEARSVPPLNFSRPKRASSPPGILHIFLSPERPSTLPSPENSLNSRHPHPSLLKDPRAPPLPALRLSPP